MIKITKHEAEVMIQKGYQEFVKNTVSKYKHYYLVEEKDDVYRWNKDLRRKELVRLSALNALDQYRKSCIVKEVTAK